MVTIVEAADYVGSYCLQDFVCFPWGDMRKRRLNLDFLSQGPAYGVDKEVSHLKVEGTLMGVQSFIRRTSHGDQQFNAVTHSCIPDDTYALGARIIIDATEDSIITTYPNTHYYIRMTGAPAVGATWTAYNPRDGGSCVLMDIHKEWTEMIRNPDGPGYIPVQREEYSFDVGFCLASREFYSWISRDINMQTARDEARSQIPGIMAQIGSLTVEDRSEMFQECCDGIFPLTTNNIANLKDLAECMKGISGIAKTASKAASKVSKYLKMTPKRAARLISRNVPKKYVKKGVLPKTAANAWLEYRYVYNTTKSDLEELHKHLNRCLDNFRNWSNDKKWKMHSTKVVDGTRFCMTVTIQPKAVTAWQELWMKSRMLGLQVNAVNIWDLVPFSFVVDWFLPVGDAMDLFDHVANFNTTNYTFSHLVMSRKYTGTITVLGSEMTCSYYERWIETGIPSFSLHYNDVSAKTKVYRALDGASLIVGMH